MEGKFEGRVVTFTTIEMLEIALLQLQDFTDNEYVIIGGKGWKGPKRSYSIADALEWLQRRKEMSNDEEQKWVCNQCGAIAVKGEKQ